MKILHLSASDLSGGAARAAYRLHQGLRVSGVDSWMLVQKKLSNNKYIIGRRSIFYRTLFYAKNKLDKSPLFFYRKKQNYPWSISRTPNYFIFKKIRRLNPDIIHLHWINNGFISVEDLKKINDKFKKPIIWTLHDSWAFTGGCHIPFNCKKYQSQCGYCPQLGSKNNNDLSRSIFERKKKVYNKINFTIVTPSNWLKNCVTNSNLLTNKKIEVIPNPINTTLFKPFDKIKAREKLSIPKNKKIILFGAMAAVKDKNKGFHLLLPAIKNLSNKKNVELIVFGVNKSQGLPSFGIKTRYLERINNDKILTLVYSSADVTVVPSLQENLPQTAIESLSCGTPVVSFKVGGLVDIINHKKNGYLAEPYCVGDLAEGVSWITNQSESGLNKLSKQARQSVLNKFSSENIIKRYHYLYSQVNSTSLYNKK